jgi:hypothetical protein
MVYGPVWFKVENGVQIGGAEAHVWRQLMEDFHNGN